MANVRTIHGVAGAGCADSCSLADQLSGAALDLEAFKLKQALIHRDVVMGLATALLRDEAKQARRASEIMQA